MRRYRVFEIIVHPAAGLAIRRSKSVSQSLGNFQAQLNCIEEPWVSRWVRFPRVSLCFNKCICGWTSISAHLFLMWSTSIPYGFAWRLVGVFEEVVVGVLCCVLWKCWHTCWCCGADVKNCGVGVNEVAGGQCSGCNEGAEVWELLRP